MRWCSVYLSARSRSLHDQRSLHIRMERAYICEFARLARRVLPRLARRDAVRIEIAFGRDRVRKRVFVDPDHRVAAVDRECFRVVLHAIDHDRVTRRGGGGADSGPTAEYERERAGQRGKRWPHHHAYVPSFDWIDFACSRCATNAGRTLTISALSSSFLALGM